MWNPLEMNEALWRQTIGAQNLWDLLQKHLKAPNNFGFEAIKKESKIWNTYFFHYYSIIHAL